MAAPATKAQIVSEQHANIDDDEGTGDVDPSSQTSTAQHPPEYHRFQHDSSILALAVTGKYIYAGTQGGEILVRISTSCFMPCIRDTV